MSNESKSSVPHVNPELQELLDNEDNLALKVISLLLKVCFLACHICYTVI